MPSLIHYFISRSSFPLPHPSISRAFFRHEWIKQLIDLIIRQIFFFYIWIRHFGPNRNLQSTELFPSRIYFAGEVFFCLRNQKRIIWYSDPRNRGIFSISGPGQSTQIRSRKKNRLIFLPYLMKVPGPYRPFVLDNFSLDFNTIDPFLFFFFFFSNIFVEILELVRSCTSFSTAGKINLFACVQIRFHAFVLIDNRYERSPEVFPRETERRWDFLPSKFFSRSWFRDSTRDGALRQKVLAKNFWK